MPTKTPDHVIKAIQDLLTQKEDQKAKHVLSNYKAQYRRKDPNLWSDLSLRRVQEIIAAYVRDGAGELKTPFKYEEWEPWREENAETSAFLLTMDAVCLVVQLRHLYCHEAKWGMQLRVALHGLTPYDQFCFVTLYAIRDVQAHYAETEAVTADLDAILAYRPWLPESAHAYGMAAAANLAKMPPKPRLQDTYAIAVESFFVGKAWKSLRADLRLPWFITPDGIEPWSDLSRDLRLPSFHRQQIREMRSAAPHNLGNQPKDSLPPEAARIVIDTALQFWMGDSPIFEKPLLHGFYGLMEPIWPDIDELNPNEEAQI